MPFRHFFDNSTEDTEFLDEFFRIKEQPLSPGPGPWVPPADVIETGDGVIARFEVAGCDPQELQLRVMGRTLHLRGIRHEVCRKRKKAYRQMEIHYGPFERTVALPCSVQAGAAVADYQGGMLEVFLPRAKRASTRALLIKINL